MQMKYSADLKPGDNAMVRGWVAKKRDLGGLSFFTLRDRTGSVQVTAKKGNVPDAVLGQTAALSCPNSPRDCMDGKNSDSSISSRDCGLALRHNNPPR